MSLCFVRGNTANFFNPFFFYTLFGWRSGKVGGWKIVGGWKSERMENIVVFPLMCLVGAVEKWEDRKLFCLVGEKKGKDGKCNYVN